MDVAEAIVNRRSVRRYRPDAVARDVLERVLELALWAPSGWGKQACSFIVAQGRTRRDLQQLFVGALDEVRPVLEQIYPTEPHYVTELLEFFETYGDAPVLVLAYAGKLPDGQDDLLSAAVALQNFFLAAHSVGLGSTWTDVMRLRERDINRLVGMADDARLVCVAPLGYPAVTPAPQDRKPGRVTWID